MKRTLCNTIRFFILTAILNCCLVGAFASNTKITADSLLCDSIITHKLVGKYAGGSTTGTGQPLYYDSTLSIKKQYFKYTTNGQMSEHQNYEEFASSDKDLKRVKEFDNAGRCILEAVYAWSYTTKLWTGKSKNEYAFNALGQKTSSSSFTWNVSSTTWVGSMKNEYNYDSQSQLISEISYNWNSSTSDWKGSQKYDYGYDSNGFQNYRLTYTWDATLNNWKNQSKKNYTFNSNGQELSSLNYIWNSTTNSWAESQKTLNEYDSKGNQTYMEAQIFMSGTWYISAKQKVEINYNNLGNPQLATTYAWNTQTNNWKTEARYKVEYTYNQSNQLISEKTTGIEPGSSYLTGETKYEYDNRGRKIMTASFDNLAKGKQKTEMAYDDNNNLIMKADYTWSTSTNNWQGNNQKYEYAFDTYGNKTLEMTSSWDFTNNVWQYTGTKYEYAFNVNGGVTLNLSYTWDTSTKTWKGLSKEVTNYNTNNQKIVFYKYVWNATTSTWIDNQKIDYTYNTKKLLTSELSSTYSSNVWTMASRYVFSYSSTNMLKIVQYDTYSKNFLYWHFIYRDKYFYTTRNFVNLLKQEVLSLNANQRNLAKGLSTTLTATISPTNSANRTIIWSSSNQHTATIDNTGKVTALENGTATITAKTSDGKLVATCSIIVGAPASTALYNLKSQSAISIYPNPSSTFITVSSDEIINKVEIINLQGVKVMEIDSDNNQKTIDVSNLKTNTYLLKTYTNKGATTNSIIIN
jgi:uncharacterized protein YjdB